MGTNKAFLNALRAGRCSFYLADFHVHSPASFDIRSGARFQRLSETMKTALGTIPESIANDPIQYEQRVLSAFTPDAFLAELVKQRDVVIGEVEPDAGLEWAVVAITDHNVCEYACALANTAFNSRAKNKIIVLPGIELDVIYRCPQTESDSQVHVLCSFRPGTTATNIQMAIRDAGGKTWQPGKPVTVTSLPEFIQGLRGHKEWPALCIAAHVASGKGVQKETKTTILSHLDAELSRLEGERQSGKNPDLQAIEAQVKSLEHKRDADSIALEVLRLIGSCGFDALQVTSTADAVHYRRLHRFRDDHGRAAPIVASDAHRIEDVFRAGEYFPHLKLPPLGGSKTAEELFNDIRRALRHGETRFSASAQSPAQYWISGIQIIPDAKDASQFWPNSAPVGLSSSNSFTLPLSRNLNTLIGGRGSGKSATIEAIAFVSEPELFNQQAAKRADRAEFYTRAEATLAGCRVKLCWQFTGGELASALPKRAIFVQRYFDPQHKHGALEYSNADDLKLVPQQLPPHPIQIFRLGEIEKQAGADRLRHLFDKICGPEIQDIERDLTQAIALLKLQRAKLVSTAEEVRILTQEGSPLREYADRKLLYESVNTSELKSAYEEIDKLETASDIFSKTIEALSTAITSDELSSLEERISGFFNEARTLIVEENGAVKPHLQGLSAIVSFSDDGSAPAAQSKLISVVGDLRDESRGLSEKLTEIDTNLKAELVNAQNALSAKGLPSGSKDREAKRAALVEADDALKRYRELMRILTDQNNERRNHRDGILALSERRSNLRRTTAENISKRLKSDLDERIIRIEADAQFGTDRVLFRNWLTTNCRGSEFKYQGERVDALVKSGLTPDRLRQLLMGESSDTHAILVVPRESAAEGDIDPENARRLASKCQAVMRLPPEVEKPGVDAAFYEGLPEEIRTGLFWFPGEDKANALDQALALDEITFDDTPVIRLNDRPNDLKSKARPVEELSPGQRCSAVLPILLLTGDSPLIIDQPEDNLDNRLIRQVIVNILASIKLRRQVIIATHNPNLPVLGDVESAIVLQGIGDRQCQVVQIGDLDSPDLAHHLTEVMEGGREAFQYRHTIYANHWTDSVAERS